MSNSTNFIFAIYTCKKNLEKANLMHKRFLNDSIIMNALKMKCYIVYGDNKINSDYKIVDNKYLILNVDDGYESLCSKTLKMCKIIYNLHPEIIGCFKCDDDIIINMNSVVFFIESLSKFSINYSGYSCMVHEKENNNIHLISTGKTTNINEETNKIKTPAALYCGGPFYYLSSNSLRIINDADENSLKTIFYEDLMIGHILNLKSIYPIQSTLYNDDINAFSVPSSFHNTEKKNTLFLKIHGGLGNQMFQIASGYGIAKKNNMNFFIINSSEIKQNFTHIDDNNYLLQTIFNNFQNINFKLINLEGTSHFKEAEEDCFTCTNITFNDDVFLDGYFQNEKYFLNHKATIISMFKSNLVYRNFIMQTRENIQLTELLKTSYFIHFRRGDYLNHQHLYGIDTNRYYSLALSHIVKKDPGAHFFILSDDIEYCKNYSVFQNIKRSYIELPPLESIYFMSICYKGGICCNSSFSWWGSYLNENKEKLVLFPSKWINKNWKNDIYYKGSAIVKI